MCASQHSAREDNSLPPPPTFFFWGGGGGGGGGGTAAQRSLISRKIALRRLTGAGVMGCTLTV